MSAEQIEHMKKQMTTINRELMRLSDVEKVSFGQSQGFRYGYEGRNMVAPWVKTDCESCSRLARDWVCSTRVPYPAPW